MLDHLGHIWVSSNLRVTITDEIFSHLAVDARYDATFSSLFKLRAKVVGVTSSEGFSESVVTQALLSSIRSGFHQRRILK